MNAATFELSGTVDGITSYDEGGHAFGLSVDGSGVGLRLVAKSPRPYDKALAGLFGRPVHVTVEVREVDEL